MASIRNLKKGIRRIRREFGDDCALLYMLCTGDERTQSALELLNEDVQSQWDQIEIRMLSYDKKGSRKEVRQHFDQIYEDVIRLSQESMDKLTGVQAAMGSEQ